MPHSVELSVYRLVQESLTNVIKHAGPASATVTINCTPAEVDVEVVDDGLARSGEQRPGGHGLAGMRERARSGAAPSARTSPRHWLRVHARIPFGETS